MELFIKKRVAKNWLNRYSSLLSQGVFSANQQAEVAGIISACQKCIKHSNEKNYVNCIMTVGDFENKYYR